MHSLTLLKDASETTVTEAILTACRANDKRRPRFMANGYRVVFTHLPVVGATEYEAVVRNGAGVVVGIANIDGDDQ